MTRNEHSDLKLILNDVIDIKNRVDNFHPNIEGLETVQNLLDKLVEDISSKVHRNFNS